MNARARFVLVLAAAWLFLPLLVAHVAREGAVRPLLMLWAIERSVTWIPPLLAGAWCGSSSASLPARLSVCGATALVMAVVTAIIGRLASGVWEERAAYAMMVTAFVVTSTTWGYARFYRAFVARREQFSIQSLLIAAAVLAIDMSLLRSVVPFPAGEVAVQAPVRVAGYCVGLSLLNMTLLTVSNWRRIEHEVVALFVVFVIALGAITLWWGEVPMPGTAAAAVLFVAGQYALLRVAIELKMFDWRWNEVQESVGE